LSEDLGLRWSAVDHEGELLDSDVTTTRDKKAALKSLGNELRKHGQHEVIVAVRLRSVGAALKEIGAADRQT
jgi:putative transposase